MALFKTKRDEANVPVSYHRILYICNSVNNETSICVKSYINEVERVAEKNDEDVYSSLRTYYTSYMEGCTASDAYSFLKSLPEFEGATDILEGES